MFSYRGTSQVIDNTGQFFTPIVEDIVFVCQVADLFCASTSECCTGLTCVNNACTETSDPLVDDVNNNAIRDAMIPVVEASNMSLGTWWLIFMLVAGIVVFIGINILVKEAIIFGFVVFMIVEFLMLIIGTKLGLLSAGIIISIVVIALIIIGGFIAKWVTGVANNG